MVEVGILVLISAEFSWCAVRSPAVGTSCLAAVAWRGPVLRGSAGKGTSRPRTEERCCPDPWGSPWGPWRTTSPSSGRPPSGVRCASSLRSDAHNDFFHNVPSISFFHMFLDFIFCFISFYFHMFQNYIFCFINPYESNQKVPSVLFNYKEPQGSRIRHTFWSSENRHWICCCCVCSLSVKLSVKRSCQVTQ